MTWPPGIADFVIGIEHYEAKTALRINILKNRFSPPYPEIVEHETYIALKMLSGITSVPTEHTAKILAWLKRSHLKYSQTFTTTPYAQMRVSFQTPEDAIVFKLFWIK